MKNIYNKKKQAWYHNSKEPDEGPAWQKFQKITSSQQVTEGRMGLKKKKKKKKKSKDVRAYCSAHGIHSKDVGYIAVRMVYTVRTPGIFQCACYTP